MKCELADDPTSEVYNGPRFNPALCRMRIFSWNVNGLRTTLKDVAACHTSASNYFCQVLNADIVCFQEAKIQEEKLEKWIACVDGYHSHWAFSREKKGYSGVVTYVKEALSPLDAKADWLGENSSAEDLCNEGRLMCTDHGSFVLLNVYVPNSGDGDKGRPRLDFKMRYLKALEQTCDDLVRSGKHIVIVGDFNVAHKDIDVHSRWKVEEIYSLEEREWLDGFLSRYIDLYRHFHPDEKNIFSVWDQKSDARTRNEGLRIDYAICNEGFLTEVLETDIVKMQKQWSDHAAVVVTLKEQPNLPPHPAPALSSCNMKRFIADPRQKKLTALFNKCPNRQVTTIVSDKIVEDEGDELHSKSEMSIDALSMQKDVTRKSNTPVCKEHPVFEERGESVKAEVTPATSAVTDRVVDIADPTREAVELPVYVSNSDATMSTDSSNKESTSQNKGKKLTSLGKRKLEADTKGLNKQRSVASFFKAANAK